MSIPVFRTLTRALQPGTPQTIDFVGDVIGCIAADDKFLLSIDDTTAIVFQKGLKLKLGTAFGKLTITPLSSATVVNNIELLAGVGDLTDSRFALPGALEVIQRRSVSLVSYSDDFALVAGTNTQIISANPATLEVFVVNLGNYPVRFSSSSTASALTDIRGHYVGPGQGRVFSHAGNLFARAVGGGSVLNVAVSVSS